MLDSPATLSSTRAARVGTAMPAARPEWQHLWAPATGLVRCVEHTDERLGHLLEAPADLSLGLRGRCASRLSHAGIAPPDHEAGYFVSRCGFLPRVGVIRRRCLLTSAFSRRQLDVKRSLEPHPQRAPTLAGGELRAPRNRGPLCVPIGPEDHWENDAITYASKRVANSGSWRAARRRRTFFSRAEHAQEGRVTMSKGSKSSVNNRANQLNPNNAAYWSSREGSRPSPLPPPPAPHHAGPEPAAPQVPPGSAARSDSSKP